MKTIGVVQGVIHVNSVQVVRATSDVIHLNVDTRHKYPEFRGEASHEDVFRFYLGASERTLGVKEPKRSQQETEINIAGLDVEAWQSFAKIDGRYTLSIVLVRRPTTEKRRETERKKSGIREWRDDRMEPGLQVVVPTSGVVIHRIAEDGVSIACGVPYPLTAVAPYDRKNDKQTPCVFCEAKQPSRT